jgi:hypothetical protein
MGKHVTDVEAAFLRMMANRVRRFTQDAAAKGEVFHDVKKPTKLESEYRVKLVHKENGPVVMVWPPTPEYVIFEVSELASEVLSHPAKFVGQVDDHLEFVPDA